MKLDQVDISLRKPMEGRVLHSWSPAIKRRYFPLTPIQIGTSVRSV